MHKIELYDNEKDYSNPLSDFSYTFAMGVEDHHSGYIIKELLED